MLTNLLIKCPNLANFFKSLYLSSLAQAFFLCYYTYKEGKAWGVRGLRECPTYIYYREPDLILVEVRRGVMRKPDLGHPPAGRRFWAFKAAAVWTPSLKRDCYLQMAVPFHVSGVKFLMVLRAQVDGHFVDMRDFGVLGQRCVGGSLIRAGNYFYIIEHLPHLSADAFQVNFPQVFLFLLFFLGQAGGTLLA